VSSQAHGSEAADDAVDIRDGQDLDWPALEGYLKAEIDGLHGVMTVRQFPGGTANLTYKVRVGDTTLVVRRPPFGVTAGGAHDMSREYRTLAKLWRVFPPAPRALSFCQDTKILGAPFLVTEYRVGVGVWGSVPASMTHHADAGMRMGLAAVRALAELHRLDPGASGLADLGKPVGFLARQVEGWRSRWERVRPDGEDAVVDEAASALARAIPESGRPALIHNDFKLDNCQFLPSDPDHVYSVFDWDMCTVGDPLVDLGTLLNYWPDPSDRPDSHGVTLAGMEAMGLPTFAEVIREYCDHRGAQAEGIAWYHAFATWKTAVAMRQLYDRYLRGQASDARLASMGPRVGQLGLRALELLERG
jgi:aminoglycoside phosphotransferase (APT) family kinase protein